jgi:hypothetical protein
LCWISKKASLPLGWGCASCRLSRLTFTNCYAASLNRRGRPGWKEDISGARTLSDLPANAQAYIAFLEKISGAPMSAIGVGPGRDQTIVVKDFI